MPSIRCILTVSFLTLSTLGVASAQEYENLQVLPRDISQDELSQAMLENLRGLGLPRRQNEGCLHCHVGDMERASDTWDWASDAKPEKVKARAMMVMVNEINREHLATLEARIDPPVTVSCYTCHAGRTDPRSLDDVLRAAYRDGDSKTARRMR